jgi:RNA polymerase sigma factor (sigma-70 family)
MTADAEGDEPRATLSELVARDFVRWRAGDAAAQQRLVRRTTPTLWHIARGYGLPREAAEDVVQTSWVALVRAAGTIRDPQATLGWLCVTTRREALRVRRESRREHSVDGDTLNERPLAGPGPEDDVLADADARALWHRVAELPPRCQQLLRVVAFDHRPDYQALSKDLEMKVGSIGPTRRRCLEKLRALLEDDPDWSGP